MSWIISANAFWWLNSGLRLSQFCALPTICTPGPSASEQRAASRGNDVAASALCQRVRAAQTATGHTLTMGSANFMSSGAAGCLHSEAACSTTPRTEKALLASAL
jgi:hypothetical protein